MQLVVLKKKKKKTFVVLDEASSQGMMSFASRPAKIYTQDVVIEPDINLCTWVQHDR